MTAQVRTPDRIRPWHWLLPVVLSTLLRLPFVASPLTVDETGYLTVASFWHRGATLYRDVWVDRPQALLLFYRAAVATGLDARGVRIGALLFGVGATVALMVFVRRIGCGDRAALLAGLCFSIISMAPALDGYAANGELLAVFPNLVALALLGNTLKILTTTSGVLCFSGRRLEVVAGGVAAAIGVLMKQSGTDAALTFGVVVGVLAVRRRLPFRSALSLLGLFGLGALGPFALSLAHGMATDAQRWWFAVIEYRLSTDSAISGQSWQRVQAFAASITQVAPYLGPLLFLCASVRLSSLAGPVRKVLSVWLAWCCVGVGLGGLFWTHYYVQVLPPLCALAGIGLDALLSSFRKSSARDGLLPGFALLALVVAFPVYKMAPVLADPESPFRGDLRIESMHAVGHRIRTTTRPGERMFALWEAPGVYAVADRLPATDYLWWRGLEQIPGASTSLAARLEADPSITVVAQFQPFGRFIGGEPIESAIRANFRPAETVDGVLLWRRG